MDWGLLTIKDLFEFLSYCTVVGGLPVAIWQYRKAVRKEQKDREYGTFDVLDQKYVEYQRLCLDYPELDVWDIPNPNPTSLNEIDMKRELVVFTILFSIFERAFLMYSDMSSDIKKKQWEGWDRYIKGFCCRENFRKAWEDTASAWDGSTFDEGFEQYINQIMVSATKQTAQQPV